MAKPRTPKVESKTPMRSDMRFMYSYPFIAIKYVIKRMEDCEVDEQYPNINDLREIVALALMGCCDFYGKHGLNGKMNDMTPREQLCAMVHQVEAMKWYVEDWVAHQGDAYSWLSEEK
jgi:hypothetical protein